MKTARYKCKCVWCGKVFYSKMPNAIYCCDECRKRTQYAREKWRKEERKKELLHPKKEKKYKIGEFEGSVEWWAGYMGMPKEVIEKRLADGWAFKDAIMLPCMT